VTGRLNTDPDERIFAWIKTSKPRLLAVDRLFGA
jgi:hypothetical protein